MNQYAAARLAYTEASVLTASPERLVVMLYDGALRFLRQASAAHRSGKFTESRDRVRRAQAVIDELNRSLDPRQGEVAARLRSIYAFCTRHLIESTAASDPDGYDAVVHLLFELRASWAELEQSTIAHTA